MKLPVCGLFPAYRYFASIVAKILMIFGPKFGPKQPLQGKTRRAGARRREALRRWNMDRIVRTDTRQHQPRRLSRPVLMPYRSVDLDAFLSVNAQLNRRVGMTRRGVIRAASRQIQPANARCNYGKQW
jgi:hypothetical protein